MDAEPARVEHPVVHTTESLGRRLFQPARPQLTACLKVVRADMSGADAWSALCGAGIIPASWRDGGARLFEQVPDDNLRVSTNGDADPLPIAQPPSAAACVAFASCDPSSVEEAERAALRLFDTTNAWRARGDRARALRPSHCVWEMLPIGGVVRARRISVVQGRAVVALEAAQLAVELHDRALFEQTAAAALQDDAQIATLVEQRTGLRIADACRTRWWALARRLDLVVPDQLRRDHGRGATPKALRGKRFAELPDIAADLDAIALAGFAASGYDGACRMFAVRPPWAALAST